MLQHIKSLANVAPSDEKNLIFYAFQSA